MNETLPLEGKRILVADDSPDTGDTIAYILTDLGATVNVVRNGLDALAAVESFNPSVVLLDIGMPGMNGYDVARNIRSQCSADIKLIALTGWGQATDVQLAMAAGFDHHLTKPADIATLQSLLR